MFENKSQPFLGSYENTCHPGWTQNEPPAQEPKVIAACQENINQKARFRGKMYGHALSETAIPARESKRKLQVTRQVFVGGEATHGQNQSANRV